MNTATETTPYILEMKSANYLIENHLLECAHANDFTKSTTVFTGFYELDRATNGFRPGEVIVIGGRPAMGKTSFMLSSVFNYTKTSNQPSLIFSFEESAERIMRLIISKHSQVPETRINRNSLSEKESEIVHTKANELAQMPIFICDKYPISLEEIMTQANQIKKLHGLKLLVLDYLQMLYSSADVSKTQEQIVSNIMIELKQMAKSIGVPIIVTSQLSKGLESRKDKVPILSDFADEAIAKHADKVLFLYRDEYYGINKNKKGVARVIIAKNRNGPLCSICMKFRQEINAFENAEYNF